jgi:outer membrane autotransporter protein
MPGFSETLTSERSAGTGQVFGEIGHKFSFDSGLVIEPFANLAHANLYTGAYAEDGGFAALSGAAQTASATNVTLGLRAETRLALGEIEATARGMVGWQHGMGGVLPTATHVFSTGDAFTVAGSAMARDAALVEAGLDLRLTPNANLGMTYNGQFGSGQQHGIKANLSVKF